MGGYREMPIDELLQGLFSTLADDVVRHNVALEKAIQVLHQAQIPMDPEKVNALRASVARLLSLIDAVNGKPPDAEG